MIFRNSLLLTQKALIMLIWLVLFCMGLSANSLSPNHDVAFNDAIDKDKMPQLYSSGTALGGANLGSNSRKEQSVEIEKSNTSKASSLNAGGNIKLVATGKDAAGSTPEAPLKEGGNITLQGSNVTAGNDATLIANDKINILAAYNVQGETFKEKSSSASVGVGVSIGARTGFGVDLAGSGARGHRIEADQSWTYSHVKAGNTTTLISGGDTNIIGGPLMVEWPLDQPLVEIILIT